MPSQARLLAADASLVGIAVIWGATFPLGKIVLRQVPPFQYLALRFALASVLMLPFAWRDVVRMRAQDVRRGLLAGVVLFSGAALQTLGLAHTTAGKAGLITGLNVVIVPLILLVWLRRLPDALTAAGVVAATCGLWLLTWQGERFTPGDGLVLGCAVAIAVHLILVGRYAAALPPAGFALLQIAVVAVLAGAAGLVVEPRVTVISAGVAGAIAFMAVGATLVAYLAQSWAQRIVSPTRTGLLFTVEPVAAVAFGMLWLGETLGLRQSAGAAVILAGVVMGELGRRREAEGIAEDAA